MNTRRGGSGPSRIIARHCCKCIRRYAATQEKKHSFVDVRCFHVLRPDSDANKARAKPAQESGAFQQPDGPGRPCRSGLPEPSANLSANQFLQALRETGGERAAALYFREVFVAYGAFAKRSCQYIGRCHSVLDGHIDPDTADRRHGVSGIADAQQAGAMPLPQPVDPDGQ